MFFFHWGLVLFDYWESVKNKGALNASTLGSQASTCWSRNLRTPILDPSPILHPTARASLHVRGPSGHLLAGRQIPWQQILVLFHPHTHTVLKSIGQLGNAEAFWNSQNMSHQWMSSMQNFWQDLPKVNTLPKKYSAKKKDFLAPFC